MSDLLPSVDREQEVLTPTSAESSRRVWATPTVTVWGSVEEITQNAMDPEGHLFPGYQDI